MSWKFRLYLPYNYSCSIYKPDQSFSLSGPCDSDLIFFFSFSREFLVHLSVSGLVVVLINTVSDYMIYVTSVLQLGPAISNTDAQTLWHLYPWSKPNSSCSLSGPAIKLLYISNLYQKPCSWLCNWNYSSLKYWGGNSLKLMIWVHSSCCEQGPTISPVYCSRDGKVAVEYYAINVVVPQKSLYKSIQQLRSVRYFSVLFPVGNYFCFLQGFLCHVTICTTSIY